MPMSARCLVPPLFSTISCASRCSVRSISSADINCPFSRMRMGRVIVSLVAAARSIGLAAHRSGPFRPSPKANVIDCRRPGGLTMSSGWMSSGKRGILVRLAEYGDALRSSRAERGIAFRRIAALLAPLVMVAPLARAQGAIPAASAAKSADRPKLVVLLVVDQMRADYVDKFRFQWTGGLKRLVEEGAWFRDAAYPYAATETCVGHSTISTGAFPSTHGMVANAWWDRKEQKMVTCTSDPNPNVKNIGYAGAPPQGADTAWRMAVPVFAEELKFQTGGATRIVTFSLKARAALTMAGHKADAATWFDGGNWVTSSPYGVKPFIEEQAKSHPAKADFGKTWSLSLPSVYWYGEKALGAVPPVGWDLTFPHPLRGKSGVGEPDPDFYNQWASSPYADTALTELAEKTVDALNLGKAAGTDFLAVSYSTVDYVGHEFGPRSREIQDILVRLDKDLSNLFAHLDAKVGRGNYVVALTADHGVVPVPADMQRTGADAGLLHLPELQKRIEKA